MILSTRHHFDAAHRLTFHKGKCRNLHGHRWEVEVQIDIHNQIWEDMIIDFKEIKDIIDKYDHATLLFNNDDNVGIIEALADEACNIHALDCEPTAENLALEIYNDVVRALRNRYENLGVKVKLWESPGNGVEV